jgi:hypothetical protein
MGKYIVVLSAIAQLVNAVAHLVHEVAPLLMQLPM